VQGSLESSEEPLLAPTKALSNSNQRLREPNKLPSASTHPKKLTRKSKITQPTRFFRSLLKVSLKSAVKKGLE
jgi:hypothetical protein